MKSVDEQTRRLKALTNPDAVAIIGASDSITKLQSRPMRFMRQHGFAGQVYPINPGRDTVLGQPAYASLAAVNAPIDHAYILLDTDAAVAAFEQCVRAGIGVVTMLADGFAESGPAGLALQQRIAQRAHDTGTLLIGPNSTGLVDTRGGFSCTTNAAFASDTLPAGSLAVISQSGSLIGTVYSRGAARGLKFSTLVSVGNEAACCVGALGNLLVEDRVSQAFLLFMETIRNPQVLARFARRAHQLGKPVVCYMIGRSDEGQALSVSHTGAMTGSAQAVAAFLKAHGIHQVENFETLLESPAALIGSQRRSTRPASVTVVSTTGGGGAMVIDKLGERGVPIAAISAQSRERLQASNIPLGHGKLVDVTLAGARYEAMKEVVTTLINDPATGLLLVAIGSSAQFNPELAVKPIVDAVAEAGTDAAKVMAFPLPQADASLTLLTEAGIPAFRTVESCAETIALTLLNQDNPLAAIASGEFNPTLHAHLDELAGQSKTLLNEVQAAAVFELAGIAMPATVVLPASACTGQIKSDHAQQLDGLTFPVAAKLISADLPHKSDAGAVSLNLPDLPALQAAITAMTQHVASHAPNAQIDGVLVQTMHKGVGEILLGLTHDPLVGPMLTVGMGGTATEIYKDATVRPAPVDTAGAHQMLQELKGYVLFTGFRGAPHADLDALAQTIADFSALADQTQIAEAEINPLLVGEQGRGVVALDALIRLRC